MLFFLIGKIIHIFVDGINKVMKFLKIMIEKILANEKLESSHILKRFHISKSLTSCLWDRYLYLQQGSVKEPKSGRSRCMHDRS